MITLNPLELANIAVHNFGALQKVPELAGMLHLVDSGSPQRIMEIGFGSGGTAWCWSKISSVEQIILVDLPTGPWGGVGEKTQAEMLDQIVANAENKKIDFISGNSQNSECQEAVEKLLEGALLDVLFIDGDHSYAGVKTDFLTYKNFVREGGLIILHDTCEHAAETGCEVKRFADELKESVPKDLYCEFISEPETWGGILCLKTDKVN